MSLESADNYMKGKLVPLFLHHHSLSNCFVKHNDKENTEATSHSLECK